MSIQLLPFLTTALHCISIRNLLARLGKRVSAGFSAGLFLAKHDELAQPGGSK